MSNPTKSDQTTTELSRYTAFTPFGVIREMLEQLELGVPRIDITHDGEMMLIQIDLPGIAPEDIEVEIDEYSLELQGERRGRQFQRVIPLPQLVDPNSAEAQFDNGVLEIKVRAPAEIRRGRRLEIKRAQPTPVTQPST